MTGQSFVPLPGSERGSLPESQQLGAVDEAQQIEVTLRHSPMHEILQLMESLIAPQLTSSQPGLGPIPPL